MTGPRTIGRTFSRELALSTALVMMACAAASADMVITASRQTLQESASARPDSARAESALEHESFAIREGVLEGFVINTSNTTMRDVVVEIRGTSADEMTEYWKARVDLGDLDPGQRVFISKGYPDWFARPEKLLFDFDPPEDPATPWPRPVHGHKLCYMGEGDRQTTWFILTPGATRFDFTYQGSDSFVLDLRRLDGAPIIPVARQTGQGNGTNVVVLEEQGVYQLVVHATGLWEVRMENEPKATPPEPKAHADTAGTGKRHPARPLRIEERGSGEACIYQ
ncbi:MAG: hypothetical protein ACOCWR_03755 [Oceanidesulfovibrio sp.]